MVSFAEPEPVLPPARGVVVEAGVFLGSEVGDGPALDDNPPGIAP
jgi:hypothetical protein